MASNALTTREEEDVSKEEKLKAWEEAWDVTHAKLAVQATEAELPKYDMNNRAGHYVTSTAIRTLFEDPRRETFWVIRRSDSKRQIARAILDDRTSVTGRALHTETDDSMDIYEQAQLILPYVSLTLIRLFNHQNLVNLLDIVRPPQGPGLPKQVPFLVWENCNGGDLERLLSGAFLDEAYHRNIKTSGFNRPLWQQAKEHEGFPEDFCWHVMTSIAKALYYLHCGYKQRDPSSRYVLQDDDWHPILHRNIEPGSIFFLQPRRVRIGPEKSELEKYGPCKLGALHQAKVCATLERGVSLRLKPGRYTAPVSWVFHVGDIRSLVSGGCY
jgi:serine/threonine protein kinase